MGRLIEAGQKIEASDIGESCAERSGSFCAVAFVVPGRSIDLEGDGRQHHSVEVNA